MLQSVRTRAGSARVMPAGSVSVKARLPAGAGSPWLSIVNVSVLTVPGPMVEGEKALEKVGGRACAAVHAANENAIAVACLPSDLHDR